MRHAPMALKRLGDAQRAALRAEHGQSLIEQVRSAGQVALEIGHAREVQERDGDAVILGLGLAERQALLKRKSATG